MLLYGFEDRKTFILYFWDSDIQRACADPVVRSPSLLL